MDSERWGGERVDMERFGSGFFIDADRWGTGRVEVEVERAASLDEAERDKGGFVLVVSLEILLPLRLCLCLRTAEASRISRMPRVRSFSSPEKVPRHLAIQPWTLDAGGRERLRPSGWNSCWRE
jgi:hypothetical protein